MSEDLREKAAWVAQRLTIVADRYEKHGQWTNGTNHDAMMIVKELRQAASLLALLPTEERLTGEVLREAIYQAVLLNEYVIDYQSIPQPVDDPIRWLTDQILVFLPHER